MGHLANYKGERENNSSPQGKSAMISHAEKHERFSAPMDSHGFTFCFFCSTLFYFVLFLFACLFLLQNKPSVSVMFNIVMATAESSLDNTE